jgi:hypothetical protein
MLKQVLKYLNGTRYLKLKLSIEDLGLHNTHWDCKKHGRAMFTLGKDAVNSYLRKLKLNSQSSTETELATADMYMPKTL